MKSQDDLSTLSEKVLHHLRSITETSGLPPGDESLERIARNWLEKRALFEDQARLLGMSTCSRFEPDDPRGIILLTYSGSLIALGTRRPEGRWFEYASIKLRSDVPALVKAESVTLGDAIVSDRPVIFQNCPIEKSSDVLLVAVCSAGIPRAEEEKRLREATVFLTNGFVKLNRTLSIPDDTIGHFTMKSMSRYLASKNDISQTLARRIVDDYLTMVEAGLLMGERIPIGTLGRLHLRIKPAQKARIGRNPTTGEEITIPAKPRTLVPRMSFSARIRERAGSLPLEDEQAE